jgi:hypothetical protein
MGLSKKTIFLLAILLVALRGALAEDWGLPVQLGATRDQVRAILGYPDVIIDASNSPFKDSLSLEYYRTRGLVGRFDSERLFGVTVNPTWTENNRGWISYRGVIVEGITITDSQNEVLGKLGPPTKVEEDSIPEAADPDTPVVWPAQARYYWRRESYVVEVRFLRQAQSVAEGIVAARGSLSLVLVYR